MNTWIFLMPAHLVLASSKFQPKSQVSFKFAHRTEFDFPSFFLYVRGSGDLLQVNEALVLCFLLVRANTRISQESILKQRNGTKVSWNR